jgi:sugar/nucleoside kinase (ribokinase family)
VSGDEADDATRGDRIDVLCAGLLVADTFIPPLHALPHPGELAEVDDFVLSPGGCAANTAIAIAQLGIRSGVAGTVGADHDGEWVRDELASRGVDPSGVHTSSRRATARTVILTVTGDDRRYIHAPGANVDLDAAAVAAASGSERMLVIGGYFALPGLDARALTGILSDARDRGTTTLLDVAIPSDLVTHAEARAELDLLLPAVDLFVPNRDEAEFLTGIADPTRQAEELLRWGPESVVVTCGGQGAVYADHARVLRIGPFAVDDVDGSGAGDAFLAGLAVGLLEEWQIERSLRFAAAVGASACRGLGCTTSLFTRDEALAVIDDIGIAEIARPR